MFRPHHPGSIEFWLTLSFALNLYNFLVQHDYISTRRVLVGSADISLILMLICMGVVLSIFVRSRKGPPNQDGDSKPPPSP